MNVSVARSVGNIARIALVGQFVGLLLGLSGCAQFRLPAIDPSGDRVFLPKSQGGTTLEKCTPKPAFESPPKPTPCPATELGSTAPVTYAPGPACAPEGAGASGAPTPAAAPTALGTGAACGPGQGKPLVVSPACLETAGSGKNQLKLTPARMVAPVGTEVVLVAGYCGEEGHFLTRQPIEWIMTQDSVGHFVEVGNVGSDCIHRLWNEKPRKKTAHYALGWSSTQAEVVTRGTATPTDDVKVGKGQTWISLTSPNEGTSLVTVWAPEVKGWDRRRQTATIHWLDAQWQFPGLAVAKAGEPHVLVTHVSRSTNNAPIAGWLVRYQIIEGTIARFANGEAEIEVPTNSQGQASVELLPQVANGGTVRVAVEIIRPEGASGNVPRLVIARGETLVTWSAAGLSIQVAGPETIPLNATAPFRITVQNQGDLPAHDIVVSDVLPPILKHVASNPQGQLFGDHVEWRLGDLPGHTMRTIDVQLQAVRAGEVRYCVRARSAEGLNAEACHERARVFAPSLVINMTGPQLVDVGGEATFHIELTNQASVALANVRIVDRFDAGWTELSGKQGPLVWPLDTLGPGETKRVDITLVARQPGQLCHTVEATADGGHIATTRACTTASAPQPGAAPGASPLRVQFAATPRQEVGREVEYQFTVTNSGATPQTNVRVVFQYKATLKAEVASPNHQAGRGQLAWIVPQMPPNDRRTFGVKCKALEIDPQATARLTVSSDQTQAQALDAHTEITAAGGTASPPTDGAAAGDDGAEGGPVTGDLTVSVGDPTDPVRLGDTATYLVVVKNERNVSDRNISVLVQLPEGYDVSRVKTSGPTEALPPEGDGRTIRFRPVTELRPNEALRPYRIELTTQPPGGTIMLRAEVRSFRSPNGVAAQEETTVSNR